MTRQVITVDIAPEVQSDRRLKVSQYDVGRPLGVYIKQDGADLDCSGYTAQLYLYKPDRTNIEKPCTITGNLIAWDTAEQETIVAGICVAEIRIREGSQNVGTANFTIWVEESPADTSGSSHSESQSLIDMVDRAEDAAETAESSAAIAVHAKDETVAAARQAVEAIESYDEMTAAATGLSAGSNPTAEIDRTGDNPVLRLGIPAGNAGYSPTVTITTITGGHRITITDATGDHSADVLDGVDGDDGYSPTVSITTITGGHRITITDKTGDHSADVMDGEDGDDGYSPTVTVTEITGGHRVTITDQQGQHPFDVLNGEDSAVLSVNGKTGPVVLDGGDINVNNSASDPETIEDAFGRVNRALNDKADKVEYLDLTFIQGGRDSSGAVQSSNYRISNDMVLAENGIVLKINPNGQQFSYRIFDPNQTSMISQAWISVETDFVVPIGCYYQFIVQKPNEAAIIPSDLTVTFEIIQQDSIELPEYKKIADNLVSGSALPVPIFSWEWWNKTFLASSLNYGSNDNTRLSQIAPIPVKNGAKVTFTPESGRKQYIVIFTEVNGTRTKVTESGWVTNAYNYTAEVDCFAICTQALTSDGTLPPVNQGISITIEFAGSGGGEDVEAYTPPMKYGLNELPLVWEQGGISNDGLNTRSDRVRAKVDISQIKAITYSMPSGYNCAVWFFSKENGTKLRDTGWDSTGIGYRLCVGDFAYIQIHKTSDSDIHPSDITNDFKFYSIGSTLYNYDGIIKTLCHRGYSIVAPENTAISFTMAAQKRMKYVETDVRFTSDGVAVMLHDASINRTARNADGTALSSTVNISNITYSQALEYDFGIYKGAEFAGEKILTFAEFVLLCKKYDLFPIIEIKNGEPSDIVALQHIAESYGMHGQYGWIGATVYLQALLTDEPTTLCIRLTGITESSINETVGLKTTNNRIVADFSIDQFSSLSAETIQGIASAGVEVGVWDISTEANVNTVFNSPYVTWFTTDGMDVGVTGIV